jgi:hypothetical protein
MDISRKILLFLLLLPFTAHAQTFDVRVYGARMDGVTNDLTALKAAVSAAVPYRGTVIIPEGTLLADFRGQEPVTLSHGVRISGVGRTSIIRTSRATPTADQDLFYVAKSDSAYLNDLSIFGPDDSGDWTTQAIYSAGGSCGFVRADNVFIDGFTNGVKAQDGTTAILLYNCELAECGMAILFPGTKHGRVVVSGCTIRDTRPQLSMHAANLFHGMYVYRQNDIFVTGTHFARITGVGVHLWDGDISTANTASHVVSGCEFDTMSVGVLSGARSGRADTITDCRFVSCGSGIRIQQGDAYIASCTFDPQNAVTDAAILRQADWTPGNVTVDNCTFTLPATNPSSPGVYLDGPTSAVWTVNNSRFYGNGGDNGSGLCNSSTAGTIKASGCEFHGSYSSSQSQAAVLNESGTVSVTGCFFDVKGYAVFLLPRNNATSTGTLSDNTIASSAQFVNIWPASSGTTINLYGGGNNIQAGGEFYDVSDPAYQRNYQLGNRVGDGGTIASASTMTFSRSYDTWHVSGTATIRTILMAGTYHAAEFGKCSINLVADDAFALSASGNVVPLSTARHAAGDIVHLEYDIAAKKWRESLVETGAVSPPRPSRFALSQNYPNPFNPSTTITFETARAGPVSLDILNLLGQRVAMLVSGPIAAGRHAVVWDASDHPSGVYFFRLQAPNFVATRRMLLVK